MTKTKKHLIKKWEISLLEMENTKGKKYKVTKRLPGLSVSETRMFKSKKLARKQFIEWLK